jgi:nucleoid-associated protein YgaU
MDLARVLKKEIAVILLPLLLGACATSGNQSIPSSAETRHGSRHLLVRSEREDRLQIEGTGEVAISSTYMAASGRKCRKLETLDGRALPLRSCESRADEWYTTRSISVSDPFMPSMPSVTSMQASNTVVESVSMTLNAGESLWSFATRVTGSPLNWKKIAAFNNIKDENSVWANQSLEVESSLLVEGL